MTARVSAICRVPRSPREKVFSSETAGISGNSTKISCQHNNDCLIRLDFRRSATDTASNTPVAPLPRPAACYLDDVHQGRVSFLRSPNLAERRFSSRRQENITVAPPLTLRRDAYLGRLLFALPLFGEEVR